MKFLCNNKWIEKTTVYIPNAVLFDFREEILPNMATWMNMQYVLDNEVSNYRRKTELLHFTVEHSKTHATKEVCLWLSETVERQW